MVKSNLGVFVKIKDMNTFKSLEEIYSRVWEKLEEAVASRHEPWRTASVATVRNNHPELRSMVLRGVDSSRKIIWFHTDLRSPKCNDLRLNSQGAVLFHDNPDHIQLRLNGLFEFDSSSKQSDEVWKTLLPSPRRCYQGPFVPGSESPVMSSNIPETPEPLPVGRENFARLILSITQMDCLVLKAKGHIRARWLFTKNGVEATWLNP